MTGTFSLFASSLPGVGSQSCDSLFQTTVESENGILVTQHIASIHRLVAENALIVLLAALYLTDVGEVLQRHALSFDFPPILSGW